MLKCSELIRNTKINKFTYKGYEILTELFEFIKIYATQLSAFGAMITFVFAIYKYQIERKTTLFWKEFEVFHKLIKELVEPSCENSSKYLDRQIAIVFELRNYKRYYPVSLRILKGLKKSWGKPEFKRIIDEIDISIKHIEQNI